MTHAVRDESAPTAGAVGEAVGPADSPSDAPGEKAPVVDELVLHDLTGPLCGAMGQLQILQMECSGQPAGRKAGAAYAALCELSDMVATRQYLMHLERDGLGEPARPLRLGDLLEEVSEAVQPSPETEETQLMVRGGAPGLTVRGCHQLLRQALCGLARVGLRLGRQVPVVLGADPTATDRVRFTVTYEGRSLPDEVAEKLFDPELERIQRDHAVRIDRAHSLLLVAAVAKAHGGTAGYEHRPNGGCFWLELPGASTHSAA